MRSFYKLFEDRHRGARSLIKSRLQVYLPIVEPLKWVYVHPEILDLGCGRGEWLELMQNSGFHAKGIDLDDGMLQDCRDLSLDVYRADVNEYLRGLDTESVCLVSALHVVEHITFDQVLNLVSEAFRVLKPGGLLILETPNSENLVVGTSSFYLDPTHKKPLPAELLSFVAEYSGFCRVKTLYLQESAELINTHITTLVNVLQGVSPDYAIIAQKEASLDVLNLFDVPINLVYGIRLNELAKRYDQQFEEKLRLQENLYSNLSNKYTSLADNFTSLTNELFQEREAIYASRSWRITKPMRFLSQVFGKALNGNFELSRMLWEAFKLSIEWVLTCFLRIINKYPVLIAKVLDGLGKYPKLKAHLFLYARLRGISFPETVSSCNDVCNSRVVDTALDDNLSYLPLRTRRIYFELKTSKDLYNKEMDDANNN